MKRWRPPPGAHVVWAAGTILLAAGPSGAAELSGAGRRTATLRAFHVTDREGEPVYRPWDSRFDLKPYNISAPYSPKTENRDGYRAFQEAHPEHSLVPNSRDRDAESTVVLLIALSVLATVFCGVFLMDKLQAMPDNKAVVGLLIALVGPWVLLALWMMHVVYDNFWDPSREALGSHWQCNAMIWYLLLAPFLTILNVAVHVLAAWGAAGKSPEAAMGRMGLPTNTPIFPTLGDSSAMAPERFWYPPVWLQVTLLVLDFIVVVFGILLVFFSGTAASSCKPYVWWSAASLAVLTLVVMVFGILTWLCTVCAARLLQVPFVHGLVASFDAAAGGDGDVPYVPDVRDVRKVFIPPRPPTEMPYPTPPLSEKEVLAGQRTVGGPQTGPILAWSQASPHTPL